MAKRPRDSGTPGEPTPPHQISTPGLPHRISNATFDGNVMPLDGLAANPEEARGPRLSNLDDLERWLLDEPPERATVMAVRAALRSIPALPGDGELSALWAFRAFSTAWVATVTTWRHPDLSKLYFAGKLDRPGIQSKPFQVVLDVIKSMGPESRIYHMAFASRAIVARAAEVAVLIADSGAAASDFWHAIESDARVLEAGRLPMTLRWIRCGPVGTRTG